MLRRETPQGQSAQIHVALLEEHAKVLEGWRPGQASSSSATKAAATTSEPRFDPIFRSPVQAATSAPASTSASPAQPTDVASRSKASSQKSPATGPKGEAKPAGKAKVQEREPTPSPASAPVPTTAAIPAPTKNTKAGSSQTKVSAAPSHTIQDILNSFMESQDTLAKGTGKAGMPAGSATDVVSHRLELALLGLGAYYSDDKR